MRPGSRARRPLARGFTLVELMIVVTIVGVLGTIGVYSIRGYMMSSKTTEAMSVIQAIRGAQEGWQSTSGNYLDVSTSMTTWFPNEPSAGLRGFWPADHADLPRWRLLNPAVAGNVRFAYATKAGTPGVAMPSFATQAQVAAVPTRRWYAIQAKADADGDGTPAYFVATSLDDVIHSEGAGE